MMEERESQLPYITPSNFYLPAELVSDPSGSQSRRTSGSFTTDRHGDSLPISIRDYLTNDTFDDGLDFYEEDIRPSSPDPLHALERPLQRRGPSRYIMEPGQSFALWSARGWLNLSAVFLIFGLFIFAFGVWPIWSYVVRVQHQDSEQVFLAHQSGPFLYSQLPTDQLG